MRYLMLSLVLLTLALSARAEDISGSRDFEPIERFSEASIWQYDQKSVQAYRIVLGPLEQVGRTVVPEKEQRLSGRLTRLTYRVPSGYDSSEVFRHYSSQLAALPDSELLFECKSRDCGSSNLWANEIFEISRLYGLIATQAYQVYRQGESYYLLYVIQRGNKRVYAHIERLQQASDTERWQRRLNDTGYLAVEFSGELDENLVQIMLEALSFSDKQLLMVVHSQQGAALQARLQDSENRAQAWRQRLLAAGVSAERVQAYGVGDMVPGLLREDTYTLVVMLRDRLE